MSAPRTITAFSTRGNAFKKFESSAQTWGELKPELVALGYDVSALLATESINRHDLAHNDAALDPGNFTIFLRPKDTKSGISGLGDKSFKELRRLVKTYRDTPGFIDHMNSTGVNYTRLSTEDLRGLLTSFPDSEPVKECCKESATKDKPGTALTYCNAGLDYVAKAYSLNVDPYVKGLLKDAMNSLEEAIEELNPDTLAAAEARQAEKEAQQLMLGF